MRSWSLATSPAFADRAIRQAHGQETSTTPTKISQPLVITIRDSGSKVVLSGTLTATAVAVL